MMWITCLSSIRSRNKAHWSFAMWPCVKFPLFKCPKMWGVRLREQHIKRIVWWWQMSCQGEQGEAELSSWNPIQQAEITGWLLLKNQLFWFKTLKQLNKHKRSLSPSLSLSLSMARTWTSERNVLLCAKKKTRENNSQTTNLATQDVQTALNAGVWTAVNTCSCSDQTLSNWMMLSSHSCNTRGSVEHNFKARKLLLLVSFTNF